MDAESDSDVSVFDEVNRRGKAKGKQKTTDRQKDKAKAKAKDVRPVVAHNLIQHCLMGWSRRF